MTATNAGVPCEGWWEEIGLGRQPMRELRMQFAAGSISGSGYDVVGLFTFTGTITAQGQVLMRKRYLGQHSVEYLGTYDGEGLLFGHWRIGPYTDRWLIRIKGAKVAAGDQAAIEEFAPSDPRPS